ncbi:MAG: T9SS type A sorting domain-containing protein [Bacteroidia bacterium]
MNKLSNTIQLIIIALLLVCFYSINAQGTKSTTAFGFSNNDFVINPNNQHLNDRKNIGKKAIKQRMDSIDTDRYDSVLNIWHKIHRSVFQYDNNGNCVQMIELYWYNQPQILKNLKKSNYAFDGNANQILNEYYNWNEANNEWVFGYKEAYVFDNLNNKLLQINYNLNAKNEIEATHKTHYIYTNNKLDFSLDSNLNQATGKWAIINKSNYTLNSNGNITSEIVIWWDKTSNNWTNSGKISYIYDANNNLISTIIYRWNVATNDWIPIDKTENIYDKNANIISQIESQWDVNTKDWQNSTKDNYVYNIDGDLTQRMFYNWTINWEIAFDGSYLFNTNYLKNEIIEPLFFSNFKHMVSSSLSQRYEDGNLLYNERGILYYSTVNVSGVNTVENLPILIYPNPTNGFLNIEFKTNNKNLYATITDVYGKVIKHIDTKNIEALQLNLSDLSNGIYFVNIRTNASNNIYKIIKNE